MNPNQKEAIIELLEDIKQGTAQLHAGVEIALPFANYGAIIHRENVLNILKSILASANTGMELLQEQAQ